MSEYVVTDTELTAVANAIRTKGGTSADLEWNADFISAINAISGGGGEPISLNDFVKWANENDLFSIDWSLVPYYTSAINPTGYTLSKSADTGTTPAWALFNKTVDPVTNGGVANIRWTASSNPPQWVQIQLPEAKKINSFYIATLKFASGTIQNNLCKTYKIQGSNDGSTFTDIYTETLEDSAIRKIVALEETQAYLYYRIYVTDTYKAGYTGLTSFFPMFIDISELVGSGAKNILKGTNAPTALDGVDGDIYLQYINGELVDMSEYSKRTNTSMSVIQDENSAKFIYSSGEMVGAQVYKQVDLTNIDTITVDVAVGSGHYDITQQWLSPCIFIENTWNPANNWLGTTVNPDWNTQTPNSKATAEIDVSSLSGNYYIVMTGYGCNVEFSNLAYDDGSGDEAIKATYLKVNGSWQSLVGQDIDDVNTGGGTTDDWRSLKDYIESSGTQWIDTGYLVKDNSRFEVIANVNQTNSAWACLFGTREGAGSYVANKCCNIFLKKNYANTAECNWGTNGIDVTYTGYMTKYYGFKTKYYFEKSGIAFNNEDDIRCDGGLITGGAVTNQYSLFLLNLDQSGSEYGADTRCSAKIYRFRIYEGDTLVHEFVPWTDSSDVVCLKDTVTGNIKYNAGTGVFTRGTDS